MEEYVKEKMAFPSSSPTRSGGTRTKWCSTSCRTRRASRGRSSLTLSSSTGESRPFSERGPSWGRSERSANNLNVWPWQISLSFRQVDRATGDLKIGCHTGGLQKGAVYSGGGCCHSTFGEYREDFYIWFLYFLHLVTDFPLYSRSKNHKTFLLGSRMSWSQ